MFRGPKLLKAHRKLNESAMPMERKVILLTDAPIRARVLISRVHLQLPPTCGANPVPVAARQNNARGSVNHVAVEEAQEAPDVVLGIFFINATSVVI
jgi:hypothetical protein